ncbi:hypothetical protein N5F23_20995 [Pseudomonas sichuanensis]|uniref:hypothetical protein n=1 Tax=Pseudomonas sichuanensis TaxID=2213015 RepID=UPI00244B8E22|nr:hypothetical protein [Pseudomonas sichuanensis]MDH0730573.1 hypothetical protein [Pseudomonas sichuanensis]MDH1585066.1 hypothetical protein [Pseudomonas sichuanensis]MDH1594060.1 hypothetical protein [Pseudomonas sichuanensis]MDH1600551.1 hypothetical protein [Pseudomonas sichuanensis]
MSYEYSLVFDDPSALQRVIERLRTSQAHVEEGEGVVCLKDQKQSTLAVYDVRFTRFESFSAWLEVNFSSLELYELFSTSLAGSNVRCFEDGNLDDEVTLREAFRIKN